MNVSLTPELEKFVQEEVGSGMYQTADEVVLEGLMRLREDQAMPLTRPPATLKELGEQLQAAIRSIEAGEGLDGPETMRKLRDEFSRRSA